MITSVSQSSKVVKEISTYFPLLIFPDLLVSVLMEVSLSLNDSDFDL